MSRYSLFICFLLFWLSTGHSQTLLTLSEAIQSALEKNPHLKSVQYQSEKANWQKWQAYSQLMPTVYFNTRLTRIDDRTFEERDFRQYLPPELASQIPQTVFQQSYYSYFDLNMSLFNPVVINGLRVAGASEESAKYQLMSSRDQLTYQVVSTYLSLIKLQKLVSLQKDFLNLSKQNYERAERLYNLNRYSKTEMLQWKVEYQQTESQLLTTLAQERTLSGSLARLLRKPIDYNTTLEETPPSELQALVNDIHMKSTVDFLSELTQSDDQLSKSNSGLQSLRSSVRVNEYLYQNSIGAYLPSLNLSYQYGWRENNTLDLDDYSPHSVVLSLSVPVFTGFQNLTAMQAALYDFKSSEAGYEDQILATRELLVDVINRIINLKNQRLLDETQVELTRQNYEIQEVQQEKGVLSNLEFLNAKLNYQQARINQLSNEYDLIIAGVEWYYLTGRLHTLGFYHQSDNER